MRCRSAVELGEVGIEVAPAGAAPRRSSRQAGGLRLEGLDLALGTLAGIDEDGATLGRISGRPEPLAVALAGGLVLEQLADLGQREAGVVAQAADEAQAVEVGGVVQAIVAVRSGGGSRRPISS